MPAPEPPRAPFDQVAALWAVARAARTFHRRVSTGRMDTVHFAKAEEELEKALSDMPSELW